MSAPAGSEPPDCGAIPPNVKGPVPCHLEQGHTGQHLSTTGCAGSEIRWTDAGSEPPDELTEAERREFEQIEDSGDTQGLAWRVGRVKAEAVAATRAHYAAALEGARAEAWDEGYDAARNMARMWGHTDGWEDPEPENPYLAARLGVHGPTTEER